MVRVDSRVRNAAIVVVALVVVGLVSLTLWGQTPPIAPTSPFVHSSDAQAGDASPASGVDLTPVFSAVFNDTDAGALGKKIKIQVSSDQTFAVVSHWNSGQIAIADVASGTRCQNVDYNGQPLSGLTTYFWRCKFWDEADAAGDWSAAATFTTGPAPLAPATLFVDSADAAVQSNGNPVVEIDQSPVFTAIFSHQNAGAIANKAKIQVSTDSTFATVTHWNSGQLTISNTAHNTRTSNIAYNGQYLQGDTVYYWRVRLYDELGNASPWSTEAASFRTILVPSAPTSLQIGSTEAQTGTSGNPVTNIDLTPVFSAVVNHPNAAMAATQVRIQVSTDSTFATVSHWKSGKINITPTLPSTRCPDVAYNGQPLAGQTTYYWRVRFFATDGGVSEWSTQPASFTTQAAPLSPTALFVGSSEAQSGAQGNPVNLIDLNPAFSAIYQHQNTGVDGTKVKVQVSTDATFVDVTHWNSGQIAIANVANGARCADVIYNGQLLRGNTRYFWRLRFYDTNDNPGPWSAEAASFITILAPTEPTDLFVGSDNAQSGASGNPVTGVDVTPVFSARFHHQDVAGVGKKIRVQVTTDPTFTNITHWNSAQITLANLADGARSQDIAYAGSPLSNSTTYYWRARFFDAYPSTGPWSIEAASFTTIGAGTPEPATLSIPNLLQGGVYSNVTVTKTGGTAFSAGNTFELVSGGISVSSVQVQDANTLLVSFSVEELSVAGNRTFQVRIGSEVIASGPAYVFYPSQRVPARRNGIAQEPLLNPALVSAGVVASTGEFLFEAQDLLLPGRMLPLGFGRNYRSFLEFDGTMGQSWASVVDDQLRYDATGDSISYFSADGRLHTLTLATSGTTGSGPYVETGSYVEWSRADQGDSDPLNDVYSALGAHGDKATYVASNLDTEGRQVYRLASMADRFNNTVLLVRDAIGRVTEIRGDLYLATEPTRHRLILDYGPDGRLKSIEDFADYTGEPADIVGSFTGPRIWNFVYDAKGRLVQVLLPKTKDWFDDEISSLSARARMLYEYSNTGSRNLITDVHSPRQVALFQFNGSGLSWLRNIADAPGRIVGQDIGRSSAADTTHRYHIVYGSGTCDVVDPLGRRARITLTSSGRVQAKAQFTGFSDSSLTQTSAKLRTSDPDSFVATFEYNNQGELTRQTMPRGNIIAWFFDNGNASQRAKGNLLRTARLPGTADIAELTFLPAAQANGLLETFAYHPDFNLISERIDSRAYSLEAGYDITQPGQLARDDSNHFKTEWNYDTLGRLLGIKYPAVTAAISPECPNVGEQNIVSFTCNEFGQVVLREDASIYPEGFSGISVQYNYGTSGNSRGKVISEIWAPQTQTLTNSFEHDSLGQVRKHGCAGAFTTIYRDQHDRVVRSLSPALSQLSFYQYRTERSFDREGNLLSVTQFDPQLDDLGNLQIPLVENARTKAWAIDVLGNITQVTDYIDSTQTKSVSLTYDEAYQVTTRKSSSGSKAVTTFDERGLVFHEYMGLHADDTVLGNAIAHTQNAEYDANGMISTAIDANGNTRRFRYDAFNRLVLTRDARAPQGTETRSILDEAGNTIESLVYGWDGDTFRQLAATRNWFDNANRNYRQGRWAVTSDGTTSLGYAASESGINDTPGWSLATFDLLPDGRTRRGYRDLHDSANLAEATPQIAFEFDSVGRKTRTTDPLGNETSWAYSQAGYVTGIQTKLLDQARDTFVVRNETIVRDELGHVHSSQVDTDPTVVYRWDCTDRMTHRLDPFRGRTLLKYDFAGRLIEQREASSGPIWELSGGSVVVQSGQIVKTRLEYDDDDNLVRIIDGTGNQTLRKYDLAGRHTQTTFADGLRFTIGTSGSALSPIAGTVAYCAATGGYDGNGNVLHVIDEGGTHVDRTYDAANLLLTVQVTPAQGSTLKGEMSASFEYDGLGRMLVAESTDHLARTIRREHKWNSLSRLEETLYVGSNEPFRRNSIDELERTYRMEEGVSRLDYTFDALDRVLTKVLSVSGAPVSGSGHGYFGLRSKWGGNTHPDGLDMYEERDNRERVSKRVFKERSTGDVVRSTSYEYCNLCNGLFASIDNLRPAQGQSNRVMGNRFFIDGLGRNVASAYEVSFPSSGSSRFSNWSETDNSMAIASEFDANGLPVRRAVFQGQDLFSGTTGASGEWIGLIDIPYTTGSAGSAEDPLPIGQGSQLTPLRVGDVPIITGASTGPMVTDDGVFTYAYDYKSRLIQKRRKTDGQSLELRQYDAAGLEDGREISELLAVVHDFSSGELPEVVYSSNSLNFDGGGVKFNTAEDNAASFTFPGAISRQSTYDDREGVDISYHDVLLDDDGISGQIGYLEFQDPENFYRIRVRFSATSVEVLDAPNAQSTFTLRASGSYAATASGTRLALGVRIDLHGGKLPNHGITVRVFAHGTQVAEMDTTVPSFGRFAPQVVKYFTNSAGGRLYRYHGYLETDNDQGAVLAAELSPLGQYAHYGTCSINPPSNAGEIMSHSQQAREELMRRQQLLMENMQGYTSTLDYENSYLRYHPDGSGCNGTTHPLDEACALLHKMQDAINRLAELEYVVSQQAQLANFLESQLNDFEVVEFSPQVANAFSSVGRWIGVTKPTVTIQPITIAHPSTSVEIPFSYTSGGAVSSIFVADNGFLNGLLPDSMQFITDGNITEPIYGTVIGAHGRIIWTPPSEALGTNIVVRIGVTTAAILDYEPAPFLASGLTLIRVVAPNHTEPVLNGVPVGVPNSPVVEAGDSVSFGFTVDGPAMVQGEPVPYAFAVYPNDIGAQVWSTGSQSGQFSFSTPSVPNNYQFTISAVSPLGVDSLTFNISALSHAEFVTYPMVTGRDSVLLGTVRNSDFSEAYTYASGAFGSGYGLAGYVKFPESFVFYSTNSEFRFYATKLMSPIFDYAESPWLWHRGAFPSNMMSVEAAIAGARYQMKLALEAMSGTMDSLSEFNGMEDALNSFLINAQARDGWARPAAAHAKEMELGTYYSNMFSGLGYGAVNGLTAGFYGELVSPEQWTASFGGDPNSKVFNAGNVFGNVAGGLVLGVVSGGASYVGTAARVLGYAGDVYQAGKALSTGDWQTIAIQVASQAAGYAASKSAAGRAATKNTPHWDPKQSVGAPHMQGGKNGWCFTAGTLVAVAAGAKPIEEIRVGDRVLTTDNTADETEVDEATWFSVSVEALNPDGSGDTLEITRLCSPQWVINNGCAPGASFHVELEEMKFAGMVSVTAMGPCPPIQKGQGRVVTMTVTHENSHVFELELSGFDAHGRAVSETLCPTDVHKLYSVERGWVMTKNLRVGEVLRTQQGAATITAIKRKAGDHRVYNFEVEATHAYYVGETRTLSHNVDCAVSGYLPAPKEPAGYLPAPREQLVVRGGQPTAANLQKGIAQHPSGPVGFSAQSAPGLPVEDLAKFYGNKYGKLGVSTIGEIEGAGGAVRFTPGPGNPYHVTVSRLSGEEAAKVFKEVPNPCKGK